MTLDLSKVKIRNYRTQWRFLIECPPSFKDKSRFFSHYLGTTSVDKPSKWSFFITQIMNTKLTRTDIRDILPAIRETLPISIKTSDIVPLLTQYDSSLTRSLIDVSVVFDASPHDLKAYIVTCFGVSPEDLQEYVDDRRKKISA